MLNAIVVTLLLLGDSQTGGEMGRLLEKRYHDNNVVVHREASGGKGVDYFLSATRKPRVAKENLHADVSLSKKRKIRKHLSLGVEYIVFGSLGGNDARPGCCSGHARKKLKLKYRRLFKQLCSYGAIVIFNGSPRADSSRWPRFDKRRKEVDKIQEEASAGTCVIRNSIRHMRIPPDPDGYHYNNSAPLYVEYLMNLPGMKLPIIEATP
tara:strand:+ start:1341 stop:1967 length:627 start_codon:yes stop_codon:yes gene_type:complete